MRTDDGEAQGRDMFALFAGRERERAARVLADAEGLLKVRGAQARCLECPAPVPALPAARVADFSPLGLLARLLFD